MRTPAILFVLLAVGTAGCGTDSSERDARHAAERLVAAFAQSDAATACEQLSEEAVSTLESTTGRACELSVLSLEVVPSDVADVRVYIGDAKVELSGGGTLFLGETPSGWKVTGLGCEPRPGQPYDCDLEG